MPPRFTSRRRGLASAILAALVFGSSLPAHPEPVLFSRDVLPILSDTCFSCHGPDEQARKSRLRLDMREGAFGTGKSGEHAVVPGDATKSELVRRISTSDADDVMPPPKSNRRLTSAQIATLRRWVEEGAPWGKHWAYETPRRPAVPVVRAASSGAIRNAIDAFVLARLQREEIEPAPEAPRETLLRRVTLDLTGLPPTPAEVDDFVRDASPDAYEKIVDRLLASPRYGERMAWEWLDAARYADSNGYQGDGERTMWPWRDWVVDALNRNLPFDQFTLWQLAGDLLPGATLEQRLATGFCRNHMINGEGGRIAEENRIDYLFDQTETLGTVWLGATLNCTRCHDHKFDPYTMRDYFGLLAFFNQTPVDGSGGDPQSKPNLGVPDADQQLRLGDVEVKLATAIRDVEDHEAGKFSRPSGKPVEESADAKGLPDDVLAALKTVPAKRDNGRLEKLAAQWKESDPAYAWVLGEQRRALEERNNLTRSVPRVMVMEDLPKPRETFMLVRGTYNKPTEKAAHTVPASLIPFPAEAPLNRRGLAQWLLSADHPLTARVTVNRAWQTFFGIGLVKTAEDFGVQGEKPSHPELLDWLATELIRTGWDMKRLHRLIVTSATYRQASRLTAAAAERDPENRLLARGPRFRMPSWMLRDVALATGGLLSGRIGGPPVKPYQPAGVWEEATFGGKRYVPDHGEALYRRSLYIFWRRIVGPTLFFDVASRQYCTVKTPRTNTPLHALVTLNDVTYVEAARSLAERVLHEGANDARSRLDLAFRLVIGRPATPDEAGVLAAALERNGRVFAADPDAARRLLAAGELPRDEKLDLTEHAAWTLVCGTILNLDEALTKE